MSTAEHASVDTLTRTAREISRQIAALTDELAGLRHPRGPEKPSAELIRKQINKIEDQIALLSSVVRDIAAREPDAP